MNMEEFKKTFEKLKDNPMYQSYCSMLETKDKVIKRLVEENNQLKEQKQELRRWLENQIIFYSINYQGYSMWQYKEVLSKLNELEGGKNDN